MTLPGGDADVRRWCVDYLARVTKRPAERIPLGAEFGSLGLDSAEMLFMVSALEDAFGLDLASDTTVEHPTVERLAAFVAGELARRG